MTEALRSSPTAGPIVRPRLPGLYSPEWMAFQSGLPARLRDDQALVAFVRRTKWWRRITFFGGLLLPYAWIFVTGSDGPVPNFFVVWVTAWFAARILPELFARHRRAGATRVATLGDRSPLRYVPDTGRRWLLASYSLGAVAIAAGRIWPTAPFRDDLAPLSLSVLVAVVSAAAIARIGRRSHPAGSPDDVLVDDAIRRLATTSVMAAWTALQFLVTFWLLPTQVVGGDGSTAPGEVLIGLSYLASFGVLAAWVWVPTRVERTSR